LTEEQPKETFTEEPETKSPEQPELTDEQVEHLLRDELNVPVQRMIPEQFFSALKM